MCFYLSYTLKKKLDLQLYNSVEYNVKSFILKVEAGWSEVAGCGSDGAFFPLFFLSFFAWQSLVSVTCKLFV